MDINITINKKQEAVPAGTVIRQLLEDRGIKTRASVWVNGKQLLLAEYSIWEVKEGDEVKILRVVAGG